MKKTAATQKPTTKTVPLSELFKNTPLSDFFKDVEANTQAKKDEQRAKFAKPTPLSEAGSCFSAGLGKKEQKAKAEQQITPSQPFGIFTDVFANAGFPELNQKQPAPEPDTTGFIAPLVFSHETFTLIEGMTAHLKSLVCNEIGIEAGARIFSLIEQIKQVAADGKEQISYTGLSW